MLSKSLKIELNSCIFVVNMFKIDIKLNVVIFKWSKKLRGNIFVDMETLIFLLISEAMIIACIDKEDGCDNKEECSHDDRDGCKIWDWAYCKQWESVCEWLYFGFEMWEIAFDTTDFIVSVFNQVDSCIGIHIHSNGASHIVIKF